MAQRIIDNARSILAASINAAATSITVPTGKGDLFPVANTGAVPVSPAADWFKLTLQLVDGRVEIVYVRTRTTGSDILSNILRAQEGTTALDCPSGTVAGLRLTSLDIQETLAVDWSSIPERGVTPALGVKTLTANCSGNHVNTSGSNIVVPPGVFSAGNVVVVYNNDAAARTIAPGAGVAMVWDGGVFGARTLEPYGLCSIFCVGANGFRIVGAGLS